jgi:hypothetical protein
VDRPPSKPYTDAAGKPSWIAILHYSDAEAMAAFQRAARRALNDYRRVHPDRDPSMVVAEQHYQHINI